VGQGGVGAVEEAEQVDLDHALPPSIGAPTTGPSITPALLISVEAAEPATAVDRTPVVAVTSASMTSAVRPGSDVRRDLLQPVGPPGHE
jgi:hypothetical protein